MLGIERRNEILAKLEAEGNVVVSQLSREFGVAEETIRRDLEKLAQSGLAEKTHGGAVAINKLKADLPYSVRNESNVKQKQYIASLVARTIGDGSFIMLDSSSTAKYALKALAARKNITVITNSVEILLELSTKEDGWMVLSTGGTLKPGALSLIGSAAIRMIESFHVDYSVCSAKGIDMRYGVTDSNENDALIKRAMFNAAQKRILAVDSSKFDKISFVRVFGPEQASTVVTDRQPSAEWLEAFKQSKTNVKY